jgi:flagellar hook-basal body complex protein FliE
MLDPVSSTPIRPICPPATTPPAAAPAAPAGDASFAAMLRRQLEQVSDMDNQAKQGMQDLLTGRTQNITEVFVAARKAEVAFSLLMEIRNKLSDAYTEIKNLRV